MDTHKGNISKVPQKLRQIRGDKGNPKIVSIETLAGEFTGENVLEGFCTNAEKLSTPVSNKDFCNDFYNMTVEDNKYIFQITETQNRVIPPMTKEDLKEYEEHTVNDYD